ncbi:MAG: serine/threonine-protein kinase [Calothrix sp. MO_167.B12]|nr:serine/threonine-protein kinase [Calothrix sp. MO_167.B12]
MLEAEQILQNRYQLQRQLGDNGIRQTWLAKDLQANNDQRQQVVVKLLAFGGTVQWEDLKLFEREVQILKQLNHPRIPQYIDYFSIDDRNLWFGLVQEYIPGASLKEMLTQGKRFTEKQVRKVAIEILNILIHLHELNPPVLHRDIKPSNLIWGEDNNIYLVDFGAVQDKAAKEGVTFTVVGTYGYAPMEQFGGKAVPASDLYALGTTLIHLLTGTSPAELPVRDLQIQFRELVNIKPSFADWLEDITEPSVERRISNAREALETLKANRVLSPSLLHTTRQPVGSRVQLKKNRKNLLIKLPMRSQSALEIICSAGNLLIIAVIGLIMVLMMITALFASVSLFSLIILIPVCLVFVRFIDGLLINAFGHQRVHITPEHFSVELWLFNLCRQRQLAATDSIQDVFQSVMYITNRSSFQMNSVKEQKEMVTIQTDEQRYSFGVGLSAMECIWLANEIKDWLRR